MAQSWVDLTPLFVILTDFRVTTDPGVFRLTRVYYFSFFEAKVLLLMLRKVQTLYLGAEVGLENMLRCKKKMKQKKKEKKKKKKK